MKKILGLDLGTTSIGWAFIHEAENDSEKSSIKKIGVRVNPLSTDEITDFEKGKALTLNASRTQGRSARRNLFRYKLRREYLIKLLMANDIINEKSVLNEDGKNTTFSTYSLRSRAVTERIELDEFARVLLTINKKRGYKSSRKAKNQEEGQIIDSMDIAKRLYDNHLTPGELCYQLLTENKKRLPDFYRSDLNAEFDRIWEFQQQWHSDILTDEFKQKLTGKGLKASSAIFYKEYNFNTAQNKAKNRKLQGYEWRNDALRVQLDKEVLAFVLSEVNGNIANSSGYLGEISDRSKELYFNKLTVGQYLYAELLKNRHFKTKKKVFYRQDYLNEFNQIWDTQSQFHAELTDELKNEVRDVVIFYQRKLKSQKSLISFCEFESVEKELLVHGKLKTIRIGSKVVPKASPLFQEFKIWQVLNNVIVMNKKLRETFELNLYQKQLLFQELNVKGNLGKDKIFKILDLESKTHDLNFKVLEGNRTNSELVQTYLAILESENIDTTDLLGVSTNDDSIKLENVSTSSYDILEFIRNQFEALGINSSILDFESDLPNPEFEKQPAYQLWHLLYSYEEDNSATGNDKLENLLSSKFGFKPGHAKILSNVAFQDDYGSLSAKAIRKILPFLKEGHAFAKKSENPNELVSATALAGYNHSHSVNKEENANRVLKDRLKELNKNSLRNPVVEKIINQMINVVNAIIEHPELGRPDEIRIELARELKKNAAEREKMTKSIEANKRQNAEIVERLKSEFHISNPTKNDIVRYKLYEELEKNGFKTLYSQKYIAREMLFDKAIDIEHIIPKSRQFDDSFSNKTLEFREVNQKKGESTAIDFIESEYGEQGKKEYIEKIEKLAKEGALSTGKKLKLLMPAKNLGDGFIERDLRETQYIAKKAKEILLEISRHVVSTSGTITERLRSDWGLVNVMQELNLEKYKLLSQTEFIERKDGNKVERIKDWTKRNDHRHHALDAVTIAFTKHSYIQYLNHLNARKVEEHAQHKVILAIENKELTKVFEDEGNFQKKFNPPMADFRQEVKKQLEHVLISFKSKNKVVTPNRNKIKTKNPKSSAQIALTPRGQLHKETVYGSRKKAVYKDVAINAKLSEEIIQTIENKEHKNALLDRLTQNNCDPKAAFSGKNSIDKNPIYLSHNPIQTIPNTVTTKEYETEYTIRKAVNPDNFKDEKVIAKIVDEKIRKIVLARFHEFNGNPKEAFARLDENPIWLNQEKGIEIKSVKITGVSNVESMHYKKDHFGQPILNKSGKSIPVDFVSTGNNHHVAIYEDANGDYQEQVVSFFEAVGRKNSGLPVIDKNFNLENNWKFKFTLKQNEYFVLLDNGVDDLSDLDITDPKNHAIVSKWLYRVQKIATRNYVLRHHLETQLIDISNYKEKIYFLLSSCNRLKSFIKVRVNLLGEIVSVGEY